MLKPKKNSFYKQKNKKKFISKRLAGRSRARKVFKNRTLFFNTKYQRLLNLNNKKPFSKSINIRVTPNNIFCLLKDLNKNETLKSVSSGTYKMKITKKTLKFKFKIILNYFLNDIKYKVKTPSMLLNIIGPIRIRKKIIKQIAKKCYRYKLTINVEAKKCFNGCRPKKKKRKKQRGMRLFK